MRLIVFLLFALAATAAFGEESVKEDMKEAGEAVGDGFKEGYDKTKDATVHTYDKAKDATVHGVGTAVEKTGEGLDAAGRKVRSLMDESLHRGTHWAIWDGRNEAGVTAANGVYFVRLSGPRGEVATTRVALVR